MNQPHHAIRQLVGGPIADSGSRRVDDRAFQRHNHHLRCPALGLRGPNVVQNGVSQIIVVPGRLRERHREKLAKIVSCLPRRVARAIRRIGSYSTYSLDREAMRPRRNSAGATTRSPFPGFPRLRDVNAETIQRFRCESQGLQGAGGQESARFVFTGRFRPRPPSPNHVTGVRISEPLPGQIPKNPGGIAHTNRPRATSGLPSNSNRDRRRPSSARLPSDRTLMIR